MTNKELYQAFRNQTKYVSFPEFLDSIELEPETCEMCEEFCANEWCVTMRDDE